MKKLEYKGVGMPPEIPEIEMTNAQRDSMKKREMDDIFGAPAAAPAVEEVANRDSTYPMVGNPDQ